MDSEFNRAVNDRGAVIKSSRGGKTFAASLPPVKGVAAEVGPAKLCWANGKHPFDCRICGVLAECYGLIAGFCGPWGCQDTPVFHSQCNAHWLFFIR